MKIVRPEVLETLLTPLLGEQRATAAISVAIGINNLLDENAMAREMLAGQLFPAIGLLYGSAMRIADAAIEAAKVAQDERTLREATETIEQLPLIAEIARRPLPQAASRGLDITQLIKAMEAGMPRADPDADSADEN